MFAAACRSAVPAGLVETRTEDAHATLDDVPLDRRAVCRAGLCPGRCAGAGPPARLRAAATDAKGGAGGVSPQDLLQDRRAGLHPALLPGPAVRALRAHADRPG